LNFAKVAGEFYISCAEYDELAPMVMVKELGKLLNQVKNKVELEMQMGVHHGFAFPQRWCYDKPAAERHWERLLSLYKRKL
jgi:carboxymethylenebutenolidase